MVDNVLGGRLSHYGDDMNDLILDHLWFEIRALADASKMAALIRFSNGRTYILVEVGNLRVDVSVSNAGIAVRRLVLDSTNSTSMGYYWPADSAPPVLIPLDDPDCFDKVVTLTKEFLHV